MDPNNQQQFRPQMVQPTQSQAPSVDVPQTQAQHHTPLPQSSQAQPAATPQPVANTPQPGQQAVPQAPNHQPAMMTPPKPPKKSANTTQNTLQLAEIRDGMVIMKDGSMRAVVMCQSINFDLMSPQERESVEYSYQGFLNSLYFPVQIFIRSQKVNLEGYMEKLENTRQNQDNILLGLLMEDYIAYMRYLTEAANIMDKQFYVVVPYYPPLLSQDGIATNAQRVSSFFKNNDEVMTISEADFKKYRQELSQQVQTVIGGLSQMGVQSIPLNTQELIELYYNMYNPDTAKSQQLGDVNNLEAALVEKGQGEAPHRRGQN